MDVKIKTTVDSKLNNKPESLCKGIKLVTDKFTHNIKGLSSILRHNRCYGSQPLMIALCYSGHGINWRYWSGTLTTEL